MTTKSTIDAAIKEACAAGVAPSIAFSISRGDEPHSEWFCGRHAEEPNSMNTSSQSIFDLASLTKPLTTTLWCLRLVNEGQLQLEDTLGSYLPLKNQQLRSTPLWRLLIHQGAICAHRQYYQGFTASDRRLLDRASVKTTVRQKLAAEHAIFMPQLFEMYTDLGFMILEWICEAASGVSLCQAWPDLPSHGPRGLHFRPWPQPSKADQYVATERCPWRKQLIQGEVHDDNSWIMGGVCGHAGLFGTLDAVHMAARQWLRLATNGSHELGIDPELAGLAFGPSAYVRETSRIFGWDRRTAGRSTSGRYFSTTSFGHLGFTGTSIWIDPTQEIVAVLLTNRVCPTRENQLIKDFRPAIHDLAVQMLQTE
ncbi:MAG: hypothetical protein CMH52_02680 [Myxococcales bacterium]|nr:hypothetical protein [Myxococcales bacterium]